MAKAQAKTKCDEDTIEQLEGSGEQLLKRCALKCSVLGLIVAVVAGEYKISLSRAYLKMLLLAGGRAV